MFTEAKFATFEKRLEEVIFETLELNTEADRDEDPTERRSKLWLLFNAVSAARNSIARTMKSRESHPPKPPETENLF